MSQPPNHEARNHRVTAPEAVTRWVSVIQFQVQVVVEALDSFHGWLRGAGQFAYAGVLLAARIWLAQAAFVGGLMAMMQAEGFSRLPPAPVTVLEGVLPFLLAVGVLTRPLALILLLGFGPTGLEQGLAGPRGLLLLWLITQGAGPLSIDFLMRIGLRRVPFSPVRAVGQLYSGVERLINEALPFATRLYLAVFLAAGSGAALWPQAITGDLLTAPWWLILLGWCLILGLFTRPVAVVLCVLWPLMPLSGSGQTMTPVSLLLLLIASRGAGKLSLDWGMVQAVGILRVSREQITENSPRVVVVGGGFGGIATVKTLGRTNCRITLIDRRNHNLFQPLLYQVATAALSPADIAVPIRSVMRSQQNVAVRLATVTGVDVTAKHVIMGDERVPFDFLVLATGAEHSYFGRDEWSTFAPGLKSIEDATAMRGRLLRAFEHAESETDPEKQNAWLTFVVVGGGPTGVELAGALAELAKTGMDMEYRRIDPARARVVLVQSAPRVLPTFSPKSSEEAARALGALGVEVITGAKVTSVDAEGIRVDQMRIAAQTTFWAAGVTASPAAKWLGQSSDRSGRIIVGSDLSVTNCPGIFAIGDTAASNGWAGKPVPGLAPAAKQQGHYVAHVIRTAIYDAPAQPPFRYRHYGNLATIGRLSAVAELQSFRLWGAPAWWFWGLAHILFLGGGRNRAAVALNWLWAYVTYRRSTRLITGSIDGPSPPNYSQSLTRCGNND
jgi:NADH dehydrogenase FAD-containing subunit